MLMALISIGIQPTTIIVLNNFITRIGCWFTTYRYLDNFVNMGEHRSDGPSAQAMR